MVYYYQYYNTSDDTLDDIGSSLCTERYYWEGYIYHEGGLALSLVPKRQKSVIKGGRMNRV